MAMDVMVPTRHMGMTDNQQAPVADLLDRLEI
jgi:hypothetical protein